MATPEVVGTLEALDLLNLDDPGLWPGEPEGESAWTVDWKSVEASNQREQLDEWDKDVGADQTYRTERSWGLVRDELLSEAGKGVHVPPPDVLDALAWYLPIHNFGYGWGIYIRESAVLQLAVAVLSRVGVSRRGDLDAIHGAAGLG